MTNPVSDPMGDDVSEHPPIRLMVAYRGSEAYELAKVLERLQMSEVQFLRRCIDREMQRLRVTNWGLGK